jgi:hypothetical protein
MTVQSFIPQVWEAKLLTNFHNNSVVDLITTPPTEIIGNTIKFTRVSNVAVKNYNGTVTFDELDTPTVDLVMDQKKYVAFKVDDVDKVQAAGDLVDSHTQEAAKKLKEAIDTYVLGLYTGVDTANVIGDDTTPKALDKLNVYDTIVDLGTKLNKKKVPHADRFVVINSDVLGLLSKDDRFRHDPSIQANGMLQGQFINGMQVVVSEEIPNANGKLKIMALHKSAIGYGDQLNNTEAIRLQDSFGDGIRSLCVHGAEVLRPEAMAVLTATIA